MITSLVNPALKLAFGVASATLTFSTDSTAAVQTTATGNANDTKFTVASGAGLYRGAFVSVEGGGPGGTVPFVNVVNGPADPITSAGVQLDIPYPSLKAAVSGAVLNRYERFETRFKAKKVTLTNLTTGDIYVWDQTLLDDQATKNPGASQVALAYNAILNRSNCIAIHPNLLPPSCSFTLKCDYDYYA